MRRRLAFQRNHGIQFTRYSEAPSWRERDIRFLGDGRFLLIDASPLVFLQDGRTDRRIGIIQSANVNLYRCVPSRVALSANYH